MKDLKMLPELKQKETGNYSLPNSYNQKVLKRGSIEFALEILRRQYKVETSSVTPYNKIFNVVNWNNFNTYDTVNSGLAGTTASQYVFYGDVIINAFDNENAVGTIDLGVVVFGDLKLPSATTQIVAFDTAAYGGATQNRVSEVNNAFVSYIEITNNTGAAGLTQIRSNIKLEGHLIRLY